MALNRRQSLMRVAAGAAALWNARVFSAVYMDIEQAKPLLVPTAASFQPWALPLDTASIAQVANTSGTRVPGGFAPLGWTAFDAQGKRVGFVLADRVVGKFELIDYAAGFGVDAAVTQVEVLAYRESHGAEIRNTAWRKQFAGRKGPSQIRFGDDIRNISGATLSCQHVTEGMQRLAAVVTLFAPKG
jgi:hypothetical protein